MTPECWSWGFRVYKIPQGRDTTVKTGRNN